MKEYYSTRVAVYVMFLKDDKLLLGKRQNTGYKDGYYAFVQGHVEEGETITQAALREAKEEVGADILKEDLEFALVAHNRVDKDYTDYFFVCRKWRGSIQNMEPDKCESLEWFDVYSVPDNSVFQVREYTSAYFLGKKFVELQ